MAIVKLKKLTFCGLSSGKWQLLETLQGMGCAHLIALKPPSDAVGYDSLNDSNKALRALKYLNQCANKRHQTRDDGDFDFDTVIGQILRLQIRVRELSAKCDALNKRIKEIEPWGDFRLPDEEAFQGLKLWFYCVPGRLMAGMKDGDLVWQEVHKDDLYSYVVVIDSREPPLSSMPVPRAHIGKIPLSGLKSELNTLELALEDLQAERESLTRWIGLIAASLAKTEDESGLRIADSISIDSDGIFIVQVWIPEASLVDIEHLSVRYDWAIICSDPGPDDKPPTLLKNPEFLSGGEEMVNFYQPPGYFGWDPSIVVFFSFSVFFSMILSDAGYAGVFGLILAIQWRKLGKSKMGLRLRRLTLVTVIASLVWGVLAGSYFGWSPNQGSVLHMFKVVEMTDFKSMMRISMGVGVAHIALANGVMFYQRLGHSSALVYLGWLFVAIGGFSFWYAMSLQLTGWKQAAAGLLVTGGLLLLLFSSERPIESPFDWFWRILEGFKSLLNISGLFGDVLSYLRLFALGLSSASMALIFNQLAEQMYHSVHGIGLVLGLLILFLGHTLNLMLCLMSGVVHGLRLNFIEFYRWGVSEEGYPFKAFSKKEYLND